MYLAALVIGFLGSLHCLGMCGPIALALPIPEGKRGLAFLIYHSGRILMYALLGAIFGLLGFSVAFGGFQQWLTIGIGVFLMVVLLIPSLSSRFLSRYYNTSWMQWVRHKTVQQFKQKTFRATFTAGALNGLLPCGLIYMAIGGTLATASYWQGATFMVIFGVGTLPALLVFWLLPAFSKFQSKRWLTRAVPVVGFALALIFIYRGVAFSIPQIDPYLGTIGFDKITICR
jgi:uncharacterized protein